jgi:putative membrane protein
VLLVSDLLSLTTRCDQHNRSDMNRTQHTASTMQQPTKDPNGAEERNNAALVRTLLAKERTYSAWVRTGLACVAAGLGIVRLLQELEPRWMVYALGALLVGTGGVLFMISFWRYRQPLDHAMQPQQAEAPVWLIGLLTAALLLAAGLGVWLIL